MKLAPRTLRAIAAAAALLVAGTLAGSAQARERARASSFRVMTFNVRFDFAEDGQNRWMHRAPLVAECVKESKASVVCFQEDMGNQDDDLKPLMPGWEFRGRGRNTNGQSERCSVAFDTHHWQCLESGDFWLSDTPEVPGSNTWGCKYPHKATWARLRSLEMKQEVMFLSTHLEEARDATEVRTRSAQVIRSWIAKHCPKGNLVQCGDFNSGIEEPAHGVMVGNTPGGPLLDVFDALHSPEGGQGTCHEFTGTARRKRIDWIFFRGDLNPYDARIDRWSKDGRWPSDHFAVWAELELTGASMRPKAAIEPQVK